MRLASLIALLTLVGCPGPVDNGGNGENGGNGTDTGLPEGMFLVGGTIEGYQGRDLALSLNFGAQILRVPAGESTFTFRNPISDRSGYNVTISSNPVQPAQRCAVTGGQGTVRGESVDSVVVDCDLETFTVGGLVSGLRTGSELVLQNNGGDDLVLDSSGLFTFDQPLVDGESYAVTVAQQPVDLEHTCTVVRAEGVIDGERVNNVGVSCKLHCSATVSCGDTTFCDAPCGGEGFCELRPSGCIPEIDRVCGCDAVVYDNECEANAAGVSTGSMAECRMRACASTSECNDGEFCLKDRGACDEPGVCARAPGDCGDVDEPVCSCDGTTYVNECEANRALQSVDFDGECDAT